MAQFRLQEGLQYIVAFGHQKNTIVILGMDGRYFSNGSYMCPLYFSLSCSASFFSRTGERVLLKRDNRHPVWLHNDLRTKH